MTEEQKEAFDAVETINEELYNKYENDIENLPILSVEFAGVYIFINLYNSNSRVLPEIEIYDSENNDRIYYEDGDKYETYYDFIKRKFIEIKEEINKVQL